MFGLYGVGLNTFHHNMHSVQGMLAKCSQFWMGYAPVKLALNDVILFLCTVIHLAEVFITDSASCTQPHDWMQPSVFTSWVTDEIHLNSTYWRLQSPGISDCVCWCLYQYTSYLTLLESSSALL
jgi:hypothetical protein